MSDDDFEYQHAIKQTGLSDKLFAADSAEHWIYTILMHWFPQDNAFCCLTWDWYDTSLELKNALPELRLLPEHCEELKRQGFSRAWLCHTDGCETYYQFDGEYTGHRTFKDNRSNRGHNHV